MEIPKDILLGVPGYFGLTGVLWAPVWLLLLVCVSHLLLPGIASFNKDSAIWRKKCNQISFKYDWSYHVIWIGVIPLCILLMYMGHRKASTFIDETLTKYQLLDLGEIRQYRWIPVISLLVGSVIAFLIFRVNREGYIRAPKPMGTWWMPNPKAKRPATVTVAYHVWCALIAATGIVYLIHHVAICVNVQNFLQQDPAWARDAILDLERSPTPLLVTIDSMRQYFMSPIYVLVPGIIIGTFEIASRQDHLGVGVDATIIVTVLLIAVGVFLLYLIPVLATGLVSKIRTAELRPDVDNVSIFPSNIGLFFGMIFTPAYAEIARRIWKRLK